MGRGGEEQSAHSSGQGRLGQLNPHRRPRPESREYAGTSPAGPRFGGTTGTSPYTSTTFQYTLDDQQTRVTGPDGSQWTYGYDLFGRKISADDLDKGLTRLSYDQLDRLTQTTDSRGTSPLRRSQPHHRNLGRIEDRGQPTDRLHLRHPPRGTARHKHPLRRRQERHGLHQDHHRLRQALPAHHHRTHPAGLRPTGRRRGTGHPAVRSQLQPRRHLQSTQEPALGGLPSRPSATNAPTPRTAHTLGGKAPYWTSCAYDDAGRRTTQTAHAAAGNTTTNYRYEKEGQPPP